VNKNEDLFNLFVKIGFMIKERFMFLEMRFCGVILLHVAKVWTGNFVVPVFLVFLNTRIW